jgi:hypothetical protein
VGVLFCVTTERDETQYVNYKQTAQTLVMRTIRELLIFCRAFQSRSRSIGFDGGGHGIEVTGANFALMHDSSEAVHVDRLKS